MGEFGTLSMKWDPKNLEIRTMSVEKTLEPLVLQVTTLVNTKGPSKKKKGLYFLSLKRKLFKSRYDRIHECATRRRKKYHKRN